MEIIKKPLFWVKSVCNYVMGTDSEIEGLDEINKELKKEKERIGRHLPAVKTKEDSRNSEKSPSEALRRRKIYIRSLEAHELRLSPKVSEGVEYLALIEDIEKLVKDLSIERNSCLSMKREDFLNRADPSPKVHTRNRRRWSRSPTSRRVEAADCPKYSPATSNGRSKPNSNNYDDSCHFSRSQQKTRMEPKPFKPPRVEEYYGNSPINSKKENCSPKEDSINLNPSEPKKKYKESDFPQSLDDVMRIFATEAGKENDPLDFQGIPCESKVDVEHVEISHSEQKEEPQLIAVDNDDENPKKGEEIPNIPGIFPKIAGFPAFVTPVEEKGVETFPVALEVVEPPKVTKSSFEPSRPSFVPGTGTTLNSSFEAVNYNQILLSSPKIAHLPSNYSYQMSSSSGTRHRGGWRNEENTATFTNEKKVELEKALAESKKRLEEQKERKKQAEIEAERIAEDSRLKKLEREQKFRETSQNEKEKLKEVDYALEQEKEELEQRHLQQEEKWNEELVQLEKKAEEEENRLGKNVGEFKRTLAVEQAWDQELAVLRKSVLELLRLFGLASHEIGRATTKEFDERFRRFQKINKKCELECGNLENFYSAYLDHIENLFKHNPANFLQDIMMILKQMLTVVVDLKHSLSEAGEMSRTPSEQSSCWVKSDLSRWRKNDRGAFLKAIMEVIRNFFSEFDTNYIKIKIFWMESGVSDRIQQVSEMMERIALSLKKAKAQEKRIDEIIERWRKKMDDDYERTKSALTAREEIEELDRKYQIDAKRLDSWSDREHENLRFLLKIRQTDYDSQERFSTFLCHLKDALDTFIKQTEDDFEGENSLRIVSRMMLPLEEVERERIRVRKDDLDCESALLRDRAKHSKDFKIPLDVDSEFRLDYEEVVANFETRLHLNKIDGEHLDLLLFVLRSYMYNTLLGPAGEVFSHNSEIFPETSENLSNSENPQSPIYQDNILGFFLAKENKQVELDPDQL
ncbi:unnamed protein product [Caenorhabditis auriculariae]|uniref:Uncharacterized protein n=1 Tax=Caenorhabditis auriculariae TaxID=2777116 RepID=A0A8S1HSA9_9PELO|nr:unnamed protein product [Caenorhabditis auriculariae]